MRWQRAVRAILVALLALLGFAAPAAWANLINFGGKTVPNLSFGVVGSDGTCATFTTQVTLPRALNASGDPTYTLSPALPAGLTFATVSGQSYAATISGNPTAADAQDTYTYTATDDDHLTATLTFTLEVVDEREALEAFYTSTGGANWKDKTNWSADLGATACLDALVGVNNNADGRVATLILRDNNLTGSLPGKLGDLTALTSLDFRNNKLSGAIPTELGNLTNLTYLNLRINKQLSGSIPTELGNLTKLTHLNLRDNKLSGSIPTQLGNLTNLEELRLNDNELDGALPTQLGNLTNLEQLWLNSNELSGSIPTELGNLTNLEDLWLNNNDLDGSIPTELGNLTKLRYLVLWGNALSGALPAELGNLTELRELNLWGNALSGALPAELGNLTNLENLALHENQFSGPIPPELGNLANLEQLWLNSNELSGSIPAELGNLTNLDRLYLHRNQLSGAIPTALGDLTDLIDLRFNENQLSGPIPPELGNLTNLERLYCYDNKLSGTLPPELGDLTNLKRLWVSSNQLSGTLPPELGDLTNLELLYLSDAQFSGAIPPELGDLTALERLSFNNNQFSGAIPPELGDLTALKLLSLSNNQLSGSIPSELGDLTNLEYLYFNYNQLSGTIPSELGDLTNLKRLYFHGNQFSGTLPSALENLTNLTATYFSVDYNASSLCLPTTPTTVKDWYSSKGFWTTSLCGTTAPGSVTVTAPDNARVGLQVTWTAPTNSAFTTEGYHVDYSTDGKTWHWQRRKLVSGATTTSAHLTGLTDGQSYYVRVRATDQTGTNIIAYTSSFGSMWAASSSPQSPHPAFGGRRLSNQVFATGRAVSLVLPAATNLSTPTYTLTGPDPIDADPNATPPVAYDPDLPAGLSFDATTRTLSGTPTTVQPATTYTYTGTDGTNDDSGKLVFTIAITPPRTTGTGTGGGGGGGGTDTATDQHGNTPATATAVSVEDRQTARRGTRTTGQINSNTDVDYFQLSVPQAGWLVLETTGSTNTQGTLWEAEALLNETEALQTGGLHRLTQAANHVTPLAQDDDSGTRQNFYLPLRVTPGDYLLAVAGTGSSVGAYTLRSMLMAGWLDNPQPASHQSGISVLSGWLCTADSVVFEVNDTFELEAAYGTDRPDTAEQCDDTDTGFGLLFNWNRLGDGEHNVTLVVDGNRLETFPVSVTTLNEEEFLTGATGETTVMDFPTDGESVRLVWQEAQQNFALAEGEGGGSGTQRDPDRAFLENPQPGSYQSGVSVLSGWACEAETVVLEVDGALLLPASYGTERLDTVGKCEDTDNGFGVLFNWNRLDDGEHTVRLLIDGEEWATATFTVTTLGEEFRRGLTRTEPVVDFPGPGETVTVEWQQAQQNFVITDWQRGEDPSP